jgi:predicted esterase
MRAAFLALLAFAIAAPVRAHVESKPTMENGVYIHRVRSDYQAGATVIRVLLPDKLDKDKRYPVIYVLPVEAGDGRQYGNGLAEIKKLDLHNKLGVICVEATFSQLPWYADHSTDEKIRQETYFLKVVLPFVEAHYPALKQRAGRLLLGFSKSGWGAFSLLLRHPNVFGKAAAWDAPVMMAMPNKYGMADIFGSQQNFEKYQLSKLFAAHGKDLGKASRLALLGYSNFQAHHQQAHDLMTKLGIPHEYRDEKKSPHTWHSGWVEAGATWLMTGK